MKHDEKAEKDFQLKWFDIALNEYNSLRNESADSLKNQQSIINYGLTAIGVLIAFSANLWGKEQIVEMIYVVFIPFLCNLIILIWNGEVRRMSRAGQYIKRIEEKVHSLLKERSNIDVQALEWETYLRMPKDEPVKTPKKSKSRIPFMKPKQKDNKIKSNYIAIIMMFGGLSLFSIIIGFFHNYSMFQSEQMSRVTLLNNWIQTEAMWIILYTILFVIDLLLFIYHYSYFQKVKK